MLEIKEEVYKGTRILLGNEKRSMIDIMCKILMANEFTEISIPIIQNQEMFTGKVGQENNNLMFNFTDRGNREICLAPEYTAVVQRLSKTTFKQQKNVKLFYVQECFRGEKPQRGRYRQFTQLGIEIINQTGDEISNLVNLARFLIESAGISDFVVNKDVTRGLDYYKEGLGFEITCERLGSSKQICGGGAYDGGVGFAIGIDRLLALKSA